MTQQIKVSVKDAGPKPTGDEIKNLLGTGESAILIYPDGSKNVCMVWCHVGDVTGFLEANTAFSKQPIVSILLLAKPSNL